MMHIVEITTHGAPEVLRVAQRPVPLAGEGELLIRVSASGVNRPDVLQRMGHYPVPAGASDVPGLEVAGVIESGDAAAIAATSPDSMTPATSRPGTSDAPAGTG